MRYCLGFVFNTEMKKVLLIRKAGLFNAVGGKLEDETPLEGMQREFLEKTHFNTDLWEPTLKLEIDDVQIYCFRTTITDEEMSQIIEGTSMSDEYTGQFLVSVLPFDIVEDLKWLVPFHAKSKHFNITANK